MKVFALIVFIVIVALLAWLLAFEIVSLVKTIRKRKQQKIDDTKDKRKE